MRRHPAAALSDSAPGHNDCRKGLSWIARRLVEWETSGRQPNAKLARPKRGPPTSSGATPSPGCGDAGAKVPADVQRLSAGLFAHGVRDERGTSGFAGEFSQPGHGVHRLVDPRRGGAGSQSRPWGGDGRTSGCGPVATRRRIACGSSGRAACWRNSGPAAIGLDPAASKSNYFVGSDPVAVDHQCRRISAG